MVPKESGFNQSETACGLCLPATARDGELMQAQHFCHHVDTNCHPNSSYITTKLWCSQTVVYVDATIIRAVFTFFTVGDTCRDGDTLELIIFRV